MDKEIFIAYRKHIKEVRKLDQDWYKLYYFLEDYKKFFKSEESKDAIKKIEEYMKKIAEKLKSKEMKGIKLKDDLEKSCSHELVINKMNSSHYRCMLCGERTYGLGKVFENSELIVENLYEYSGHLADLDELVYKLVTNDEDVVEGVLEEIRNHGNESVLIRRR